MTLAAPQPPAAPRLRRRWRYLALALVAGACGATAWWQAVKPLPAGTQIASAVCAVPAGSLSFVADITAADAWGRPVLSQGIFDQVLQLVRGARRFIVLDYRRFGAAPGDTPRRHIAAELTDALLAQQRAVPGLKVLFITDPASEAYGAGHPGEFTLLRAAGADVVVTELDALRDSNLAYSAPWRLALRWWDTPSGGLRAATRRLNFKANDRKLVIADDGAGGLAALVASAEPYDGESAWSNVALRFSGRVLEPLLASELAVARFSGWRGAGAAFTAAPGPPPGCAADEPAAFAAGSSARVQVLTEGAIRAALLRHTEEASRGEAIDVAMFCLAERGVTEALLAAARRGVRVRLLLDPNEDATRTTTAGLPNQPVASELVARSGGAIHVRWYRTHGERFHSALVMVYGSQRLWLTLGSADLTRRALDDYNLEANVAVELARGAPLAAQALGYFDTLWDNHAALGIEYSADFAAFADPSQSHYWLSRLLEGSGWSAF